MALGRAALGGLAGGAVGAAVWAGITYATHREIGWIAWGVGGLVGLGVRLAVGEKIGVKYGAVAAVLAALSIVGGKYAAVSLIVDDFKIDPAMVQTTDATLTSDLAREVVRERAAKGKGVRFAAGKTAESADGPADFPTDVWKEATKKWADLGKAEQDRRKAARNEEVRALMADLRGAVREAGFRASFTPFDLLWFALAMFTAFRLGSGAGGGG